MDKIRITPYRMFFGIMVPTWLLENPNITDSAKLVYGRLCLYAGDSDSCYPKQQTLADSLCMGKRQLLRHLRNLEDNGLIGRKQTQTGCIYHFYLPEWCQDRHVRGVKPNTSGVSSLTQPYKETHLKESIKEKKNKYLEFVLLTPKEYSTLQESLSSSYLSDLIKRLNNYIGSTGKTYKSHYYTILNWKRREEDGVRPNSKRSSADFGAIR